MVLLVSRPQLFLTCHREVSWVLFYSYFIPVKCLNWWRTNYIPMLMTPHYWQLFASQQTGLLSLPPLTGTWLGFRSHQWCMILYPNKTKHRVISRSRTANPPHGDLVMSGVSHCASPSLDILWVKFDSRFTFEDHVRGIVSRVSQRIGILKLVKHVFVDISVLLRCYYALVLAIIEYCSPVWGLLRNVIFSFSSGRCIRWLGFAMICLSCRCVCVCCMLYKVCCEKYVILCMSYKVNSNSYHSLFIEFISVSVRCKHLFRNNRAAAADDPLEFQVPRCRTS